jgi:hypothetical protein
MNRCIGHATFLAGAATAQFGLEEDHGLTWSEVPDSPDGLRRMLAGDSAGSSGYEEVVMTFEEFDAHLDPWCEAPLDIGDALLFGYALHYEETGGLAWLRSSRIVRLQTRAKRSWTASGRRYKLGRRFEPLEVCACVNP